MNDDFDYDEQRLKLQYTHRIEWMSVDLELKSRLQVERRDYQQVLEAQFLQPGSARRADERFRAGLELDCASATGLPWRAASSTRATPRISRRPISTK